MRLAIDLVTRKAEAAAIAFDLFPRQVNEECKYRHAFRIESTLKFAFAEAKLGANAEGEGLRYEPRIIAFGLLTACPSWTFQSADRQGHAGIYEMFLLVKKPKGVDVHGRFKLGEEVYNRLYPLKPA